MMRKQSYYLNFSCMLILIVYIIKFSYHPMHGRTNYKVFFTVEDWYKHQLSIYHRKTSETKQMDYCRNFIHGLSESPYGLQVCCLISIFEVFFEVILNF